MKKILLFVATLCLLVFSLNTKSFAATPKTVDFSKPIFGVLQNGSMSYKFDVAYTTDFMFASYLGNSPEENDKYSSQYTMKIYDNKNKVVASSKPVATSARMSYFNEQNNHYYVYQVINQKLKKGSYILKISGNLKDKQKYSIFADREIYGGDVRVSSLTASPKSPESIKKTIALSTKATGSYLQYKYTVINKTKKSKEMVLRNYSSNKTTKWKPTIAGTYTVKVTVKNTKSEKTSSKTITYKVLKK